MFADMTAAFEALPDARRRQLDGLKITTATIASWRREDRAPLTEEQKAKTPDVDHPLVRTHPVTGQVSLSAPVRSSASSVCWTRKRGLVDDLVSMQRRIASSIGMSGGGDIADVDNRCTFHT